MSAPKPVEWELIERIAAAEAERDALKEATTERVAQLTAHRACIGAEHNPAQGKLHGYCVVCGVPWPCEYAGISPASELATARRTIERLKADKKALVLIADSRQATIERLSAPVSETECDEYDLDGNGHFSAYGIENMIAARSNDKEKA
jgi:hypothetical protein